MPIFYFPHKRTFMIRLVLFLLLSCFSALNGGSVNNNLHCNVLVKQGIQSESFLKFEASNDLISSIGILEIGFSQSQLIPIIVKRIPCSMFEMNRTSKKYFDFATNNISSLILKDHIFLSIFRI